MAAAVAENGKTFRNYSSQIRGRGHASRLNCGRDAGSRKLVKTAYVFKTVKYIFYGYCRENVPVNIVFM